MTKYIYINQVGLSNMDILENIDDDKRGQYEGLKLIHPEKNPKLYFVMLGPTVNKWISNMFYKKKINSYITNGLKLSTEITNKSILHNYTKKNHTDLFNRYFMDQFDIDDKFEVFDTMKPDTWYILKVIGGRSGEGQIVFNNNTKGKEMAKKFITNHVQPSYKRDTKTKWIAQEYIKEPYLLKRKKFHMRVLILLFDNKIYFYNYVLMIPATKEYNSSPDLITDKEIHDTHLRATPITEKTNLIRDYIGDKHWEDVYERIKVFITELKDIDLFKNSCYESPKCFRFLGIDVILTKDNKLKCIEINYSPRLKHKGYTIRVFEGLTDIIINKKPTKYYTEL